MNPKFNASFLIRRECVFLFNNFHFNFDLISALNENHRTPFGKKVKNEVRLASLKTIDVIESHDSTEEAIKMCGFLKFVSLNFITD